MNLLSACITFVAIIFLGSCSNQLLLANAATIPTLNPIPSYLISSPIFDSTQVPVLTRDYTTSSPSSLASASQTEFVVPTAVSKNRVWLIVDNRLINYVLADDQPNRVTIEPKLFKKVSSMDTMKCQHPLASPTRDSNRSGFSFLYILCVDNFDSIPANVIITVSVNDESGQYIIDSAPRITIQSNSSLRLGSLQVIQQDGGESPDLLIVPSHDTLFVVDSSTGLLARKKLDPTVLVGVSYLQFIIDSTAASGVTPMNVYCLGWLSEPNWGNKLFVTSIPAVSTDEWVISKSETYNNTQSLFIIDSPSAVFLMSSSSQLRSVVEPTPVYRVDKSTLQVRLFLIPTSFNTGMNSRFYELSSLTGEAWNGITLFVEWGGRWYHLDWNQGTIVILETSSEFWRMGSDRSRLKSIVDRAQNQVYFYSEKQLAMFSLEKLIQQPTLGVNDPDYVFKHIEYTSTDEGSTKYPSIFQSSEFCGNPNADGYVIFSDIPTLSLTPAGVNGLLIYSSVCHRYGSRKLTIQMIKAVESPSCQSLTLNSSSSDVECICQSLSGKKTARNCQYQYESNQCQSSVTSSPPLTRTDCASIKSIPSEPDSYDSHSSPKKS